MLEFALSVVQSHHSDDRNSEILTIIRVVLFSGNFATIASP